MAATPITWSEVSAIAAGVASTNATAQALILGYVEAPALNSCYFGGDTGPAYKLARIYLAAHMAAGGSLGGAAGVRGPITAEAAGGMSKSYGGITAFSSGSTLEEALARTVWGGYLLEMIDRSAARGPFVI